MLECFSDQTSRGPVAALGNLSAQVMSAAGPSLAGYLLETVSQETSNSPAAGVLGLNAILCGWLSGRLAPEKRRLPEVGNRTGRCVLKMLRFALPPLSGARQFLCCRNVAQAVAGPCSGT